MRVECWSVATACCLLSAAAQAQGALTLGQKAALFQHDIEQRFMTGEGQVACPGGQVACKLKVPTAGRDYFIYNSPDNAYMTGMYVGALSMKYAVTKDPADREAARRSLRALHLLSTVSGVPGLLARAAWPADGPAHGDDGRWRASPDGKHLWRGEVSSDQMDGVLFGYALAYDLVADDADKQAIARNVGALVGHVLDHGLRIVDADGKPTRWGNYTPQYVQLIEPMNALLLLQLLKVAHHVTGDSRFAEEYRRLALDQGYADIAIRARKSLGAQNYSDDVLLFLGYYPLLSYETDPALRERYLRSLGRSWRGKGRWRGENAQGNPLYAFAAKAFLDDASGVAAGLDTLRWFPLDMKWNRATIAAYEQEFAFRFEPAPQSPVPEKGQAVPVDRREKSWSAWVMDPFTSAGDRTADSSMEYNGHDYLLAYWLGRYLGVVPADA